MIPNLRLAAQTRRLVAAGDDRQNEAFPGSLAIFRATGSVANGLISNRFGAVFARYETMFAESLL
jgi:hypothetical protein